MKFEQKKGIIGSLIVSLFTLPIAPVVYASTRLMNENKKKILELLYKNQIMNISEIQRSLKISYKETHRHIGNLIEIGAIERVKKVGEKHQPVYLSLSKEAKKSISSVSSVNP